MSGTGQVKTTLVENLRELHLQAMLACFEDTAQRAEKETFSYEQYLLELSERECEQRQGDRIRRLMRDSGLPVEKSLANFDLKRLPTKVSRQMKVLLEGGFLERKENLLAFGNPGAGKSHLLRAIAQELISSQRRKIECTTCALLVQDLLVAKPELQLRQEIKKLAKYEGLVIDQMGYVQQSREEMEVSVHAFGGALRTWQCAVDQQPVLFQMGGDLPRRDHDGGAIDRLVHHCIILELNIQSYRMEQAKKNRDAAPLR